MVAGFFYLHKYDAHVIYSRVIYDACVIYSNKPSPALVGWGSKEKINFVLDLFIVCLYNVTHRKGGATLDKTIIFRADDDTLEALERIRLRESEKRLGDISASECIRYLIKKEALSLDEVNKK